MVIKLTEAIRQDRWVRAWFKRNLALGECLQLSKRRQAATVAISGGTEQERKQMEVAEFINNVCRTCGTLRLVSFADNFTQEIIDAEGDLDFGVEIAGVTHRNPILVYRVGPPIVLWGCTVCVNEMMTA